MAGAEYSTNRLFSVRGRVVLITGGSRGIGAWLAEAFAYNGATVYISSRKADACETTADRISGLPAVAAIGGACIAIPADVADEQQCKRLVEQLAKREKRLHVLINNAGATWGEEGVVDSTLSTPVSISPKLCLPLLIAGATPERPANIINIGSINGIGVSMLETYSYSASKAALHQLTRVLAAKLADKHITVNAIAPGPFPTKMLAPALKEFEGVIIDTVPLHRLGKPTDLTGMGLLLAAPTGAYITGAVIPVDGGILVKASL